MLNDAGNGRGPLVRSDCRAGECFIELAYFDDLSQSAIADRLGVPLGTVKSWTRRGPDHLATQIAPQTS